MSESDLFRPYDRLVRIELEGDPVEVPDRNTLLRCFQYVAMDAISYGDYCWNGECAHCEVAYSLPDGTEVRRALACRTFVVEEMKITKLSRYLELDLKRR